MADSKRELILRQVVTVLGNVSGIGSPARVYRSLAQALADTEGTSIVVRWTRDLSQVNRATGPLDRTLLVFVGVAARESGSDSADKVADAVMVDAYDRLMADPTLGGRCLDIEPGEGGFTQQDGNNSPGIVSQEFR